MKWLSLLLIMLASPVLAQSASPGVGQPKVDQLLELLRDPEIQTWLSQRPNTTTLSKDQASSVAIWETATRGRIDAAISAIPRIPVEVAASSQRVRQDALSRGYAPVLPMMFAVMLVGIAAETWFKRRRTNDGLLDRFLPVGVFSAAMAIVFFTFPWPPLGRVVMAAYLAAFVVYRIASTAADLVGMDRRLRVRVRLFVAVATFAVASAAAGKGLGVDPAVRDAISYLFSVFLLVIAVECAGRLANKRPAMRAAICLAIVAIWLLWCVDLPGLFWLGVYAFILPAILRSVGTATNAAGLGEDRPLRKVLLVRGARAVVALIAVGWLAFVWHVDTNSLAHQNPEVAAFLSGALKSVVVLLLADLVWHLARTAIEQRIKAPQAAGEDAPAHAAAATRLHTLLPIFRNVIAVVVVVVAALTVLAELGVEIGPLIAGAGIFGVALGFGSQTLVKDVISGVFYMLDDAFRVGEYIQAKSYKGTVEGFSLRSVRLRHHRGPVFTVPFGELGAVENMSRDWSVDKFRISVAYSTDIEKARKLTKKIGAILQADPEFGPLFIEPLKMKGVEEFGDYGIVLSFGMTLRPGQTTSIRRKAYALIREAFTENDIEFATPSVQVGGDERQAAAVSTVTRLQQAKAAATET